MLKNLFRRRPGRISLTQLHALYVLIFFLALFSSVPSYANSSFLETILSADTVGVVFAVGSLLSLLTLVRLPRVLARFGVFRSTITMLSLELLVLFVLSFSPFVWLTITAFILHLFLVGALFFSLDIFVESFSSDEKTGTIRGTLLTVMNTAVLASPLILAFILGDTEKYSRMYLTSAALLVPTVLILVRNFKNFKDPVYERTRVRRNIVDMLRNRDLFNIFGAQFLLRFFYAWMVIYTPIYLTSVIGFTWAQLGPIFTVMLLPFPLFQMMFGRIADKHLGEQEMLMAGFVVMALATGFLSLYTEPNIWVWATLLFLTRVGASAVETMTDSYFFKKINSTQTGMVALFRIVGPAAYVIAPLVSTVALTMIDIRYTFILLGGIVFTGVIYAGNIRDTR